MLYVTTRNHQDAYTVQHVLTGNKCADAGFYVPLHLPKFTTSDLDRMTDMSFNQRIAEILNLFFGTKLTGWDVDFSAGRYPVRMELIPHRIIMAETWHNPQWKYKYLEERLCGLICAQEDVPGNWAEVAVRMAVLAAIILHQMETYEGCIDISSGCGDFTVPISAWYLREMGFPVGNIICCCNENNHIWELICLGQTKVDTMIPQNLERLICACCGHEETIRYLRCCKDAEIYAVSDKMLQELRKGLFVSVVSSNRTETAIPNVYKTHHYVLDPDSAQSYSGLMDYRAKTGISRPAVVLYDESPSRNEEIIARCMDLSTEELRRII